MVVLKVMLLCGTKMKTADDRATAPLIPWSGNRGP